MQFIRHILGLGDGEVVGCSSCGTVELLIENQKHQCEGSTPFARPLTIDASQLQVVKPAREG